MKLSLPPKLMVFSSPRWMLMYFFAGYFWISPSVWWPNSGFWCCVFLTLRITLLSCQFSTNYLLVQERHHWDPSSNLCCLSITLPISESSQRLKLSCRQWVRVEKAQIVVVTRRPQGRPCDPISSSMYILYDDGPSFI
jgi:hypothetical protein